MMNTAQIPIWIFGKSLWISGVNSETTVSDIMETLFGSSNIQYTIMQKWRQIERPLNGNTKILKLWKTWGDAKSQVKLSLTKVVTVNNLTNSNAISTKKRNNLRHTHDQAKHSKRLTQSPKSCNFEKLLKVILLQRKTIQTQIYIAIEQLEAEQNNEGFDLLDAMSILKTSKCSKITAQHSEIELKKLKREIHQLKKVVKINKKLESKEEHLIKLFTGIECFKKNNQMLNALKFDVNKIKKSKHKWRKTN